MTETKIVHFSIEGEFITEHVRNLWQERRFAHCLKTLGCVNGLTRDQHEAIIFGKAKLTGVNDLELEEDNWQPPDPRYYCPSLLTAMEQGEKWWELQERREHEAYRYAKDNWWETRGHKDARMAFFNRLVSLVGKEKAEQIHEEVMYEYARSDSHPGAYYANQQISQKRMGGEVDEERGLPAPDRPPALDPETMVAHAMRQRMELMGMDTSVLPAIGKDMTERVMNRGMDKAPVLCPDMSSASGWLLPDGKYYGCGYMEHIGLATRLLEGKLPEGRDAEKFAEDIGWVKITKHLTGTAALASKTPTKRQLTKLWDYSVFHKLDYEELINSLPIN
jgi:hypothetical protein